jgi:hypothetical protein
MRKYFYTTLLVLAGISLLGVPKLFAQFDASQVGDPISVSIYPAQPGPSQNIEVDAESYSVNLDTIKLTWLVNGRVVNSGIGLKSITATTGAVGSKTTISLSAATPIGDITKTVSVQPASVHLSWEGVTYTPGFYKGAPLPVGESGVNIVAFPELLKGGIKVADGSLIYTWKVNGSVISDSSGYGKNAFLYKYPQVSRPVTIEVVVSTTDQSASASASVNITPTDPKVVIYEDNPVLGLLTNTAINQSFSIKDAETRVVAVPYFFSTKNRSDFDLAYKWAVAGNPVLGSADDPSAIVLRPDAGASGSAEVSVDVNQTNSILQAARSLFTIIFGKS